MVRTLQSLAITLFFVAMMFFLFRDHVIPNWNRGSGIDVDRSVLTDSWANQDEWNEIRIDDFKIGALRTTAEYEEEGNYYRATAHLEVNTTILKARILSTARLNHRLEIEHARVRAQFPTFGQRLMSPEELDAEELPAGVYELTALLDGRSISYRLRKDGAVRHDTMPLARPVTVTDSLMPIMRGKMLTRGVVYAIDVYDPVWGNNAGKMEVEYLSDSWELIGGDATMLRKVEMRLGTNRTHMYVDDNGVVQRREIPLFPSGQAQAAGSDLSGTRIIFDRRLPTVGVESYPALYYVPAEVEITRDDVTGKDQGDLTGGINLFSAFSGSMKTTPAN